jgi:uncharacterized membrane protein YjgN (DUF898 family)
MAALAATYYDVLGVGPKATLAEIKAAYRQQLDLFRQQIKTQDQPDPALLDRLRQAFTTLGDPAAREAYDAALNPAPAVVVSQPTEPPAPPSIPRAPAVPMADADETREENFSFAGDGGEYFRIWIVNLLLTIVTLGIYSAWAKVRREQYFHRNLLLDGSGFDYHGQPIPILKGRIVAFLLLLGLSTAQNISPLLYGIALLALLPVVPWLAVKAFRFRSHNTSYRGLRFSFHGTYAQALKVFIGYGLLAMVTFWLAFPLFYRQLRKFVLDNTRFGSTPFECSVSIGAIYRIFLFPALIMLLLMVALIVVVISAVAGGENPLLMMFLGAAFVLIPLLLIAIQALLVPYVQARTANAVWNSTRLGAHCFVSRLPIGGYIGLTVVNWLAIICTLGLFIPWARVRVARYRAEHLAMAVSGSLDDFLAAEATAASALGDETAEMFDLDIGL